MLVMTFVISSYQEKIKNGEFCILPYRIFIYRMNKTEESKKEHKS